MNEVKYMNAYNKHCETAQLILKREGREKLEWLHSQIANQMENYTVASESSHSGGFFSRLAKGASASKVESLKPKLDAYADALKADDSARSQVDDMMSRMYFNCPYCEKKVMKVNKSQHMDGKCQQGSAD